MTTKYAFLDTNIFLHYVGFGQIDWRQELSCDHVVLVLAPVVIRQLNEKKDSPGGRKLRERAGSALKRLDSYSDKEPPITIREGVELRFQSNEPLIDFATHRLSQVVSDDWLIASILGFKNDFRESCVTLVTGDLGLKLKAKNHGIIPFSLSEQYKLPEEEEPDRKRIRDLEEQVLELESRIPRLKLAFNDDTKLRRVKLVRSSESQISREMIDQKMGEIRCRYSKMDIMQERVNEQTVRVPSAKIDVQEFIKYNNLMEQFWADFEDYLERCAQRLDWLQRWTKLELFLVNSGNCPADDIDVIMHFPDGVEIYQDGRLPKLPEKPIPPISPRTSNVAEVLSGWNLNSAFPEGINSMLTFKEPESFRTAFSNVGPLTIQQMNSYEVRVKVHELKHHFNTPVAEFYVAFPTWEAVGSFEIGYALFAKNIPRKVEDTLNVVVEMVPK